VHLLRDGRPVELAWPEVVAELDPATAWFWLQLKPAAAPLDVDLDLAASEGVDNPAYYVRYTLGRARSIVARAAAEGLTPVHGPVEPAGRALAVALLSWPDALRRQPQRRVRYAREVAAAFHAFYATQRVFGAAEAPARLALVEGTARVLEVVLEEGLGISGC
jgi:arginyl-tRNA synthetase